MKKLIKVSVFVTIVCLLASLAFFSPKISAKTKYKTKAENVRIEKQQVLQSGEHITSIAEVPFETTHLGLHWKERNMQTEAPNAFVRMGMNETELGDWIEVDVDEQERKNGNKVDERFAALAATDGARFAQAKFVLADQNKVEKIIEQITFTFINSMFDEEQEQKLTFVPRITAQTLGIAKTSPHGQELNVISREEWEADESYRLNSNGEEDWPRSYHGTRKIVVHHTADAGSNGQTDLESNMATVRAIYYYHAVTRLWGDIGYNALVDAAGNVYEGRYGTIGENFNRNNPSAEDVMVLDVEAAHASSYNAGSFGVSAMGDLSSFEFPEAQREGLKNVLAFVADSRGIDVQGSSDFLRYDGTWHRDLNNVVGHRDVGITACPGDMLYAQMTSIKSEVDSLSGMPSNIHGFSATVNGADISGQAIGSGLADFNWDDFSGAVEYKYAIERIFGTIYDPQPWEASWMNETNTEMVTNSEISVDTNILNPFSQYVFYVGAVDSSGAELSTIAHVNFKTDDLSAPDTVSPEVWITAPVEGYESAEKERLTVSAQSSDNVAVTKMEIFFDGKLKATCDNNTNCSVMILMRKESFGEHVVESRAFDAEGNSATAMVNFTKAGSTPDDPEDPPVDPDDPKPPKCTPWPSCKK